MTCEKHAYWSAIGEYEGNWRNNCRSVTEYCDSSITMKCSVHGRGV